MTREELLELLKENKDAVTFVKGVFEDNKKYESVVKKLETMESEVEKITSLMKHNEDIIKKQLGVDKIDEETISSKIKDISSKNKNEDIEIIKKEIADKYEEKISTINEELEAVKKDSLKKEKDIAFENFLEKLQSKGFKNDSSSRAAMRAIVEREFSKVEKFGDEWGVYSIAGTTKHREKTLDEFADEVSSMDALQVIRETSTREGAENVNKSNNQNQQTSGKSAMQMAYEQGMKGK